MAVMKCGVMESLSSYKKKAMASFKSPNRRRRMVKVTAQCLGPHLTYLVGTTFQIQMAKISANLKCFYVASLGLIFKGPNLPCLGNHARPNLTKPSLHTRPIKPKQEEGSFSLSPKRFTLGRIPLPETKSNKKEANQIPAKYAKEGSGQGPCKKEASRFEEDKMALRRKGLMLEQEGHTKKRWWIMNPHQEPSKVR